MADILPPAPINEVPNSYGWTDWYFKLRTLVNEVNNLPWASVNKAGSNLADLQTRNHNDLLSVQGGGVGEYYHLTSAQHTETTATRATRGVDTTDYLITVNGVVLQSPNGHYWVASISNLGVLTWTDVGTTKP